MSDDRAGSDPEGVQFDPKDLARFRKIQADSMDRNVAGITDPEARAKAMKWGGPRPNTLEEVAAAGLSEEICPDCGRAYPMLTCSGLAPTPCGFDAWGDRILGRIVNPEEGTHDPS